jgi:hypothetical protein
MPEAGEYEDDLLFHPLLAVHFAVIQICNRLSSASALKIVLSIFLTTLKGQLDTGLYRAGLVLLFYHFSSTNPGLSTSSDH